MDNTEEDFMYELHPKVTYHPKQQLTAQEKLRKFIEVKHGIKLETYWDFHEWSVKNYPEFWEAVWQFFNIVHSQSYSQVVDRNKSFGDVEWFPGARLNFAENIFKFRDDHLALILLDEEDNLEKVTYAKMYDEVALYASSLRNVGVQKGDRIACYISNRKEAVYIFLAAASIGAVFSGALPLLGAKAVLSRFEQISPKVLLTVDRFSYNQEEFDMLPKVQDLCKGLPSLEYVVVVPSRPSSLRKDLSGIPKSCFLPDFLKLGLNTDGTVPDLLYEQLPFDHPISVSYTSGTTGKPKGLVHSAGAVFACLKDYGIHQNCGREDVILSISPAGWITWTMYTNSLILGLTVLLFEGVPFYLKPHNLWNLVDEFGITHVLIPSANLEDFTRTGYKPTPQHSLKTLKLVIGAGSPVKPQCYDFVSQQVKPGVFFASLYGSTELLGFASGVDFNMPVHKGEIQCFSLGVDVKCIDEKGNYLIGKRGDMVIANPLPSLPVCLYADPDKKKFKSSYLSKYPGHWSQNDEFWINPLTKGFVVFGRSDETMNPRGARYSSSEIYAVIDEFPEVEDSVCVSQYSKKGDERTVLFVKMKNGNHFSKEFEMKAREAIEKELSNRHVPEIILETQEIPYNLNSKKMELIVKQLINNQVVPNRDVVKNPTSLDFYINVPELQGF